MSRVVQSVRASYLPGCVTQNECQNCNKVIKAKVIESLTPISVTVNFVYASQYQFLIEYDFQGLLVTSAFKVVISIDNSFGDCFSEDDYNQQLQIVIDPATLAKNDRDAEQTLAFDIEGNAVI